MNNLFTQKQVKGLKWLGNIINCYYLTAPIFSLVTLIFSAVTMYAVIDKPDWLTLPVYFGMLIAGGLLLLWLFWKFILPVYYGSINKQIYDHDNPMVKDLKAIKDKLGIKE